MHFFLLKLLLCYLILRYWSFVVMTGADFCWPIFHWNWKLFLHVLYLTKKLKNGCEHIASPWLTWSSISKILAIMSYTRLCHVKYRYSNTSCDPSRFLKIGSDMRQLLCISKLFYHCVSTNTLHHYKYCDDSQ